MPRNDHVPYYWGLNYDAPVAPEKPPTMPLGNMLGNVFRQEALGVDAGLWYSRLTGQRLNPANFELSTEAPVKAPRDDGWTSYHTFPEAVSMLGSEMYKNMIGQPLEAMQRVGGAMAGEGGYQIDEINDPRTVALAQAKDVLDALSLYSGPGILAGKPQASAFSTFGGLRAKNPPVGSHLLERVQNFKHWSEGLPVVDIENMAIDSPFFKEGGVLIKGKHGTTKDFELFGKSNDIGYHIGTAEQASSERFVGREGGRIMPLYAKVKNPLSMQDLNTWQPEQIIQELYRKSDLGEISRKGVQNLEDKMSEIFRQGGYYSTPEKTKKQYEAIRNFIKEEGYDSIVYMNRGEGKKPRNSFIILDPEQIRTGIGQEVDSETLRAATGWHKGMEGLPRFEIDDSAMRLSNDFIDNVNAGKKFYGKNEVTQRDLEEMRRLRDTWKLEEVLQHDELFKQYPELKDVPVSVNAALDSSAAFTSHGIEINPVNSKDWSDSLIHEIQHWIQEKEGFARGGNPDMPDAIRWARDYEETQRKAAWEEFYKISDKNPNWKKIPELVKRRDELFEIATQGPKPRNRFDYYRNLAGEIEARDAANRRTWPEDLRRAYPPDVRKDAIIRMDSGGGSMVQSTSKTGGGALSLVVRTEGASNKRYESAITRSKLTQPGHVYRGMTEAEYNATIGANRGVKSRGDYSFTKEGTSFGEDFDTAESYINFGRDDPRITGKPNYIVEVTLSENLKRNRQGYYEASAEIPKEQIKRVWKITPNGEDLVASEISGGVSEDLRSKFGAMGADEIEKELFK